MLAVDLVQYLTEALYVIVFALALPAAIRHPRPATIQIALLFGAAALSVAESGLVRALGLSPPPVVADLGAALVLLVPYLLLRLVDEFAGVPALVQHVAEVGLALCVVAQFLTVPPRELWLTEALVAYFGLVILYVTVAFARAGHGSMTVTARRMGLVAAGSACLAAAILIAALRAAFPFLEVPFSVLGGPFGLVSGLAFYLGFTTPTWLRRSWYEPDLTTFISRADRLAEQLDTLGLLRELQTAAAGAIGLPGTFVGLWNEEDNMLEYAISRVTASEMSAIDPRLHLEGELLRTPADLLLAGRCFKSRQPLYAENIETLDPDHADLYLALGVKAVIAAPMTVDGERYGVLGVYTPRMQLFGEDSLARVQLLARHAATMLRSRKLLQRAASLKAQQELIQSKEDFLSAATHDLKTPLTAIKGIAQWGQRRARAAKPADPSMLADDFSHIEDAADRMKDLIDGVLDVSRLQMGRPLELARATVDLVELARRVAERQQPTTSLHRIRVEASSPITGSWDADRLDRALENLIGNAVKFSPDGGEVLISITKETNGDGEQALMAVQDGGIGIRPEDAERIFTRFERGSNAAERGIAGTGIGLAYIKEVVAAHGGQIAVESREDVGSVFKVRLPLSQSDADALQAATAALAEATVEVG